MAVPERAETLTHPAARGDTSHQPGWEGGKELTSRRFLIQLAVPGRVQPRGFPQPGWLRAGAVPGCQGIPLHAGRSSHLPLWSGVSRQLCVVSCNSDKVSFLTLGVHAHTQNPEARKTGEGKFRFDGFRLSFTPAVSNAFSELSS